MTTGDKIKYNDIQLFLWLIPAINLVNYYLTYPSRPFGWYMVVTYSIDTIEGYIAWLLIRGVILYLDRRMPYQQGLLKRLPVQLVLTIVACLTPIIALTELINSIASDKPVPAAFYRQDIFLFMIWVLVINGIYIGIYFYRQWKSAESEKNHHAQLLDQHLKSMEDTRTRPAGIMVRLGKKDLLLDFDLVVCIYVEAEYTVIIDQTGKKYLVDQSLDKIEKSLPTDRFFRVNRQYILQRKAISGFEHMEHGKLNVLTGTGEAFPDSLVISRLRAPAFRDWFQQ